MKLEKKHWIWIGFGVAAITAGIIIHKKRKAAKEKALEESAKNAVKHNQVQQMVDTSSTIVNEPIKQVAHFPLKKGSSGYEVMVLQGYMNSTCKASLKAMNTDPLELNGVWDEKMEISAINCSSIKKNEIDEVMYSRIYRDMKAANILPNE